MKNIIEKKVSKEALKPRVGDAFSILAPSILSTVSPTAGYIASIIQIYLGKPASRRAEAFILSIEERVTELEQKGLISKESLLQDPGLFVLSVPY